MARGRLPEACWRFEQISPLLDPRLTGAERHRKIEERGRLCVQWPSGKEAPISASTFYRWLWAYESDPKIESLMRLPRPSRGIQVIAPEWISYALALVEEEAERSLFVLAGSDRDRLWESRFRLPSHDFLKTVKSLWARCPWSVSEVLLVNGHETSEPSTGKNRLSRAGMVTVAMFILLAVPLFIVHPAREDFLAQSLREGRVRLGYSPEAPSSSADSDSRVTGAWPEVARKVLDRMGIRRTERAQCEFRAPIRPCAPCAWPPGEAMRIKDGRTHHNERGASA